MSLCERCRKYGYCFDSDADVMHCVDFEPDD